MAATATQIAFHTLKRLRYLLLAVITVSVFIYSISSPITDVSNLGDQEDLEIYAPVQPPPAGQANPGPPPPVDLQQAPQAKGKPKVQPEIEQPIEPPVDTPQTSPPSDDLKKGPQAKKSKSKDHTPPPPPPRANDNSVEVENGITDAFSPALEYRPIYKMIEKSYKMQEFAKLPLVEKCEIYFQKLIQYDNNWWASPKLGDEIEHGHEGKSNDLITINLYNHCFMEKSDPIISQSYMRLQSLYDNLDVAVYPYLTGKMPLFQRWNGEISYGPPVDSKIVFDDSLEEIVDFTYDPENLKDWNTNTYPADYPFWEHYRNSVEGTGIVVSVNDELVDQAISLIGNLRTLDNELPIQFIHRGDLSNASKQKLAKAARSIVKPTEKSTYPKQDIWFVDVSFSLFEKYHDQFQKFFNKMLAYGFNSFANMIMLDTDVVLFQKPEDLLSTSQYKLSQTLLFKDRNLSMRMSDAFIDFLKSTSPNKVDQYIFGVNAIVDSTWNGEYFTEKYFHYMESGVVAIDRLKYWNAVILSMHLSFIQSTIIGSWGDKEHFWMGMLLSGFDDFQFNEYWSASVGEIVTLKNEMTKYNKICSSHPAHILSDTGELSWLNSGVANCPKATTKIIMRDFNTFREAEETKNLFKSLPDLENFYFQPMAFEGYIIPPLAKYDLDKTNKIDSTFSNIGLEQMHLCGGYTWCAFDRIGFGQRPEYKGTLTRFTPEQIEWYDYIAESYTFLDL